MLIICLKQNGYRCLLTRLHKVAYLFYFIGRLSLNLLSFFAFSSRLVLKSQTFHHLSQQTLPAGVPSPFNVLSSQPLSPSEISLVRAKSFTSSPIIQPSIRSVHCSFQISNVTSQLSKQVGEIKVKHKEDLVVPFGVP